MCHVAITSKLKVGETLGQFSWNDPQWFRKEVTLIEVVICFPVKKCHAPCTSELKICSEKTLG